MSIKDKQCNSLHVLLVICSASKKNCAVLLIFKWLMFSKNLSCALRQKSLVAAGMYGIQSFPHSLQTLPTTPAHTCSHISIKKIMIAMSLLGCSTFLGDWGESQFPGRLHHADTHKKVWDVWKVRTTTKTLCAASLSDKICMKRYQCFCSVPGRERRELNSHWSCTPWWCLQRCRKWTDKETAILFCFIKTK